MKKNLRQQFIYAPAPLLAQYLSMIMLLILALPLVTQLPLAIILFFALLWSVKIIAIYFNAPVLKKIPILLLLLASIGVVLLQLKSLWGRDAGIALLLLLIMLKAYETKHVRDSQFLLVGALFLSVGAILFSQSIGSALWTLLSLFAVLLCISVLDNANIQLAVNQTLKGLLFTLPIMLVLFLAFPRLPGPLWRTPIINNNQSSVGISDTMKPGSISELIQHNELAFNAVFKDNYQPKKTDLYWRMVILSDFDGKQWQAITDNTIILADNSQNQLGDVVDYDLLLSDWKHRIPALDYPHNIDKSGMISSESLALVKRSYPQLRRVSLSSTLSASYADTLSPVLWQRYTKIPNNLNFETKQLARQLFVASHNTEHYIHNILKYFHQQPFIYTLNPPLLNHSDDEIDEFLFHSKQGFCEHYASAFAFMLRSVGIPARVVVGYQGGEYNAQAAFWQIRSKDAHAWVEVWLAEKNLWLRVDPTSAVAQVRMEEGIESALGDYERLQIEHLPNWLSAFSGQAQFYWQNWVIDFDAKKQNELFKYFGFAKVNISSIIIFLVLGLLLALLPMMLWWKVQADKLRNPLQEGYILLKQQLITDSALVLGLGPEDFKQYLSHKGLLTADLARLIDEYIQLRYQPKRSTNEKQSWLWLKKVKKVL